MTVKRTPKTPATRAKEALDRQTRVTAAAKTKAAKLGADAKTAREAYDTHERRRAFLATDPDLPQQPAPRARAPRQQPVAAGPDHDDSSQKVSP